MKRSYKDDDDNEDLNANLLSFRDQDDYELEQEDSKQEEQNQRKTINLINNYSDTLKQISSSPQRYIKQIDSCSNFDSNIQQSQKQQPFVSSIIKKKLSSSLEKDGYSKIKEVSESLNCLTLNAFSKKQKKEVLLEIVRCTQEDYEFIKVRIEKIIQVETMQFVQKYYAVLYYPELFLSVIVQEPYKQTLKDELQQKQASNFSHYEKNVLIFQITHALTEIHSYNMVHYAISPSSIIKNSDGVYKISRFQDVFQLKNMQIFDGFDKSFFSPETILYLSDKKFSFDCIDFKSDVYSIGLIVMEFLKNTKSNSADSEATPSSSSELPDVVNNLVLSNQNRNSSKTIPNNQNNSSINQQNNNDNRITQDKSNKGDSQIQQMSSEIKRTSSGSYQPPQERFSINSLKNNYINLNFQVEEMKDEKIMEYGSLAGEKKEEKNISAMEEYLLNPDPQSRMASYELFNRLSQFIDIDTHYIHSMVSSIHRSLRIDIFSRNKQQGYFKMLRLHYSELRLQLFLLVPKQNPETIFHAYKSTSLNYISNGDYTKGLSYAQAALLIARSKFDQNRKEIANLLIVISLCLERNKEFNQSLENSLEAYNIVSELDQQEHLLILAKVCCRLSWAYCRIKNGEQALLFGKKSLEAYETLNPKKYILFIAEAYDALGSANELLENQEDTLKNYEESLKLRSKLLTETHPAVAQGYYNIGLSYKNLKKNKEALQNFIMSASLFKKHTPKFLKQIKQSYLQAHSILIEMGDLNQAELIQSEINKIETPPQIEQISEIQQFN